MLFLSTSMAVAAAGCADELPSQGEQLELDSWLRDSGGLDERSRLVIRDQAAWEAAWQQISSTSGRAPAAPSIDFETSTVIVAAMGRSPSTGYRIEVTKVTLEGSGATVTVLETSPGRGCGAGDAITSPIDVFVVPRFEGKATFVEKKSSVKC